MPIYIANTVVSNRPSTTIFTAKGLPNLAPCILNNLVVMGTPGVYQEAYDEYRSQIAAFLSATALGKTITTHLPAYDLGDPCDPFLSIPPMFVKPSANLSDDEAEAFLAHMKDYSPVKEVLGKFPVFFLNKANLECAVQASQGMDEKVRAKPGCVTPENVLVAATIQTLVTRFLQTQTYSAGEKDLEKSEEESMSEDSGSSSSEEEEEVPRKRKEKVVETFVETFVSHLEGGPVSGTVKVAGVKRKEDVDELVSTMKKKKLTVAEVEKFQEDFKEIWEEREVAFKVEEESSSFQVSKAKPSPFPEGYNRGGVRDVPNEPGLLFPYFDRMLVPDDQSIVAQFMATGFYKLLNNSLEGLGASLSAFLPRLRRLGQTDFGAVHSHILLGVNLALQTQSRLFLIVQDGEYLGFTLHGYKYSVWVGPQRFKPKKTAELADEVCKLSSHHSAVKELCSMLSEMKVASKGEPEEVTEEDFGSSQRVFQVLKERVLTEVDELEEQLRLLKFSDAYLPLDVQNLKNAFEALATKDISSYEKKPKYLSARFQFSRQESEVFACFGPEFISPVNAKGSTFRVEEVKERTPEEYTTAMKKACGTTKKKGTDELPSEKSFKSHITNRYSDPKEIPERLILPKKPVLTAVNDWISFISSREMKMDPKERAGLHRCVTSASKPVICNFWKATSLYASNCVALKRKSGEPSKAGKKKVASSGGFLGLFGVTKPSVTGGESAGDAVSEFLDAMDDAE